MNVTPLPSDAVLRPQGTTQGDETPLPSPVTPTQDSDGLKPPKGQIRVKNQFPRGARVRCEREAPAKGCWPQFAGKVGTVRYPDNLGEVGVVFGSLETSGTYWFLPSELVRVARDET